MFHVNTFPVLTFEPVHSGYNLICVLHDWRLYDPVCRDVYYVHNNAVINQSQLRVYVAAKQSHAI
jgi:hypothetical protein